MPVLEPLPGAVEALIVRRNVLDLRLDFGNGSLDSTSRAIVVSAKILTKICRAPQRRRTIRRGCTDPRAASRRRLGPLVEENGKKDCQLQQSVQGISLPVTEYCQDLVHHTLRTVPISKTVGKKQRYYDLRVHCIKENFACASNGRMSMQKREDQKLFGSTGRSIAMSSPNKSKDAKCNGRMSECTSSMVLRTSREHGIS
ncbi:hypothetical protein C8R45DRAFT_948059 [Mycena sanguinolenta]|nr:hypothetical protein C8R45DRAFT_948059 [Mycena sanguinolenta]